MAVSKLLGENRLDCILQIAYPNAAIFIVEATYFSEKIFLARSLYAAMASGTDIQSLPSRRATRLA
jgi:hypothetical protein